MGRQGRTKQGRHQGVGVGEIEIEPIAPVTLKLRHGGEGLLDGEQRTAYSPEAATQRGRLHTGELNKGLLLKQVVFPLQDVRGQARPLPPEGEGGTGQAGDAVATDQAVPLPILKGVLHGWIHRIGWAGFVQPKHIYSLHAELSEAYFQATATMGNAEIPVHHAAAVDTASQRAQAWSQL